MEPALHPSRRSVTRGALWTVPVVAVATAAPAYAASPCNCPEFWVPGFPASGTLGGGWAMTADGGTSGGGTDGFSNGSFVTVADPRSGGILGSRITRTVIAARDICVTEGRTYNFTYGWTAYLANTLPMTSVLRINGVDLQGSLVDTAVSTTAGTRNVSWVATSTGNVRMEFVHTTRSNGTTVLADDITILNVAGSCS